MKLVSLEEMGTGQVVRKEIQRAFNFVWKIMFSSMLLNIGLSLPHKSSTSNYCPNALLKLCFWPLFWNLLRLLPSPDLCSLKFEVKWSEVKLLSPVRLFAIPWTVVYQASSVHGFFQATVLEWVAISFSRGSCIAGRCFTLWATREALSEVYFLQTTGHIFHEVVRSSFGQGSLNIYTEHQKHPDMA